MGSGEGGRKERMKERGRGGRRKAGTRAIVRKESGTACYTFFKKGVHSWRNAAPGLCRKEKGVGGKRGERKGEGNSGHTWATTERPPLTLTKENRYAWFTHARACRRGLEGSERDALARGAEGYKEKEREREAKESHATRRRTGGRGVAIHSPATHFSSLVLEGGRASIGCSTTWSSSTRTRDTRTRTRVILCVNVRSLALARAHPLPRDGEGYVPRCYPLGHSISRVRGTLAAVNRYRFNSASPRVLSTGVDAPLLVNWVFPPRDGKSFVRFRISFPRAWKKTCVPNAWVIFNGIVQSCDSRRKIVAISIFFIYACYYLNVVSGWNCKNFAMCVLPEKVGKDFRARETENRFIECNVLNKRF